MPTRSGEFISARLTSFARLVSVAATILGVLSLSGWALPIDRLKAPLSGEPAMEPNCAVTLICSALALRLLMRGDAGRLRRRIGLALAGLAVALAALTLAEYGAGWNLGIDRMFVPVHYAGEAANAARMGLPGALGYTLLGCSLLLLARSGRRSRLASQYLALAVVVVALLPLFGYSYGARELYGIPVLTSIALDAALALLALALGVLAAQPLDGMVELFCRADAAGSLGRHLLLLAVPLPFATGWVIALAARRHWFDAEFAVALLAMTLAVMLTVMLWRAGQGLARAIEQRDLARKAGDEAAGERDAHRHLLMQMVENLPVAMAVVEGRDLRYTLANPAYCALARSTPAEIIGRAVGDVFPQFAEQGVLARLLNVLDTGQTRTLPEIEIRFGDRSSWWSVTESPLGLPEQPRGVLILATDITGYVLARKRIEELARSAEDANRVKDEFLATLSHELRTPLNAIVGWSSMLVRGGLQHDAVARAHDVIFRNAQVQRDLIDDVLDVSRITSGKVRIDRRPTEVRACVTAAIESVRPAAAARQIAISSRLPHDDVFVFGDRTRLQQVVWNLLSNAVKFTPVGGTIRVTVRRTGSDLEIQVADNGIGIDGTFLPHIFERFRQRDSSSTRSHGGLGLGLSIVQHLVQLHGGTVRADSAGEGRGATFTIRLPRGKRKTDHGGTPVPIRRPTAVVASHPPHEGAALSGIRVLAVDDEADARELTASVLRHYGATVAVAASAAEGLAKLEEQPDVLLLDIAMPGMDGYELLERIRARGGAFATIPAIALTAYAREDDRLRAEKAGFQRHIAKPAEADVLVSAVAGLAPGQAVRVAGKPAERREDGSGPEHERARSHL